MKDFIAQHYYDDSQSRMKVAQLQRDFLAVDAADIRYAHLSRLSDQGARITP